VAAFPPTNKCATCSTQQFAQRTVELRGHSGGGAFCFAERGDLEVERSRIDLRMIIG
jgi:hypothetical protein